MSAFFDILLWPLTAFSRVVGSSPKIAIAIGVALTVLGFAMHHGAWASVAAMFVGYVLIWLSETQSRLAAEQGVAARG